MKISVAQTSSIKGDILANIENHIKWINLAASNQADAIFFPELSLTGYEPELAKDLAIDENDESLHIFQELSDSHRITVGLGVPTKSDLGIRISMFIFQPLSARQVYSKQLLHVDEIPFFVAGDRQILIEVDGMKLAPGICYESLQRSHSEKASQIGADLYIASVAKSQNGIEKAKVHYPAIAKAFSMPVLMSNCVGFCDNFMSVGSSSAWTKDGILVGQLDDHSDGILILDTVKEKTVSIKV